MCYIVGEYGNILGVLVIVSFLAWMGLPILFVVIFSNLGYNYTRIGGEMRDYD